jgi:hypothetical protein
VGTIWARLPCLARIFAEVMTNKVFELELSEKADALQDKSGITKSGI